MTMASHWDIQHHVPRSNQDASISDDTQKFTLVVQDFESSVAVEDSASITSSMSRPSTFRRSSSESGLSYASCTTFSTTSKRSRPHSLDINIDGGDQHYSGPSKKRARKGASTIVESPQIFACPYARYNPNRYSASNLEELNYRSCSKCYLTDIARVKQHLYRVHDGPRFHCPTCQQIYENQNALMKHVLARNCTIQECAFSDKMTAEQSTTIRKKTRGADPYLTWYDIYGTLFPGASLPPSPYAAFSNPGSESLDAFMHFVQEKLPQRLRKQLCNMGLLQRTEQDTVVGSVEANLANVVKELRREFDQPLHQGASLVSREASSTVSKSQPHPPVELLIPMEAETFRPFLSSLHVPAQSPISTQTPVHQSLENDDGQIWDFESTSDDAMNWQFEINNDQNHTSDILTSSLPTEPYGPPTTMYNPQAIGIATPEAGDYFVGFHQAVTMPH